MLVGPIPSSLGDIATLSDLSLAGNELSGSIPDSFGNLTLLRYLRYAMLPWWHILSRFCSGDPIRFDVLSSVHH